MGNLAIVKLVSAVDARSAEMRYLRSMLEREAREVFERVDFFTFSPAEEIELPGGSDVLAIGAINVLILRRSLQAMRARIDAGMEVVVPYRTADCTDPAQLRLYTLRDYEGVEERLLCGQLSARAGVSHLPVSFWSAEFAARITAAGSLSEILTGGEILGRARTAHAGLCHDFIDYYGQVRGDVMPFLPEGTRDVLEVGCGSGATGVYLRDKLGCRVTGVELNPAAAALARRNLAAVLEGDAAELPLGGPYDVVLALDVFEHLVEGERFLMTARRHVRPGGRIILSVPNVGHYSIVADLLAGRWDYVPIGLLCYSHLRFFTRRTLEDWLHHCDLHRFEIVAQTSDLPPELAHLASAPGADLDSLRASGFYVVIHI